MKKVIAAAALCVLGSLAVMGQSDQHYTMFMYNKLYYNPGYTGSRDITSFNAQYRNQWSGIPGAPKTLSISAEAPVGSYMRSFRKVALGLSVTNEKVSVENNTNIRAYYAYRIKFAKSVLSMGVAGGGSFYSALYSNLSAYQQNDQNLTTDVRNAFLPNVGAGVYWSTDNAYVGLSIPSMLQNKYDKNGTQIAKQIRAYYLSAGYVYPLNEIIKLKPQVLARFAMNGQSRLPLNFDFNASAIAYDRVMAGITYRTDKSLAGVVHIQATQRLNVGYSYDFLMSDLAPYARGAHEVVVGYDISKERLKFATPRFSKAF